MIVPSGPGAHSARVGKLLPADSWSISVVRMGPDFVPVAAPTSGLPGDAHGSATGPGRMPVDRAAARWHSAGSKRVAIAARTIRDGSPAPLSRRAAAIEEPARRGPRGSGQPERLSNPASRPIPPSIDLPAKTTTLQGRVAFMARPPGVRNSNAHNSEASNASETIRAGLSRCDELQ